MYYYNYILLHFQEAVHLGGPQTFDGTPLICLFFK